MDPLIEILKKTKSPNDGRRTSIIGGFSSNFLKLALTTGVVLSFAIIFFVFNTFGETKINVTINSNPDLSRGLMVHWTFDGPDLLQNVADSSGNGNTGYLTNFTSTTTVPGKIGQALSFDGINDHVYANPTDQTGNFTISMWVKAGVLGQGTYEGMFASKSGGAAANSFQIDTNGSDTYRILFSDSSNAQQSANFGTLTLKWQYLTATWDGTTVTTYMNGVKQNTATFTYTGLIEEYNVGVNRGSNRYSQGQIDDFRVYNRALSAKEIKRLYQQGATTYINKTITSSPNLNKGLVGHWTFDGPDMTSNVADSSGNGNTGYLTGFTSTTTVPGKIGQALKFDGVSNHVYIDSEILNQVEPNGFSAFMWLKSSGAEGGSYFWEQGQSGSFTINANWTGGGLTDKAYCRIRNSASTYFTTPSVSILDGEWHHVGCSFSTTTKAFTMYVDGASTTSVSAVAFDKFINNGPSKFFNIGARNSGGSGAKGTIDDFRIYNRSLSANEVKRLYQQGATTYINKTIASSPDLNRGLVGHWTFDGPDLLQNVADSSGNGNTGYLKGFTSTTTVPGKMGQALSFDGVDDYVQTSDPVLGNTSFTASAWFKRNATGNTPWIVDNGKGASGGFQVLFVSDKIRGRIDDSGANGATFDTSSTITDTNWHHIVLVADKTGIAQLYLDGVQDGATLDISSYGDITGTLNLRIGAGDSIVLSKVFSGSMDDVRIYNRALSANEIRRLYKLGR